MSKKKESCNEFLCFIGGLCSLAVVLFILYSVIVWTVDVHQTVLRSKNNEFYINKIIRCTMDNAPTRFEREQSMKDEYDHAVVQCIRKELE